MTRRCLVTGGAGFIGSHLVDHLVAENWAVTVLDDFSTGTRANLQRGAEPGRRADRARLDPRPAGDRGGDGGKRSSSSIWPCNACAARWASRCTITRSTPPER